jgi:drug/metabolite transporter (DMT)-like permease
MGAGSGPVAALGLSSAAVWGAADFSGGLAAKRAAPAFVVAVAHGFSLLLLFFVAALFHASVSGYGLDGLLSGVFCAGGLIALYAALSRGAMGLSAAVSGVLTAIFPVLVSWLRDGRETPIRLIGFAVAAAAIWLIAYTPEQNPDGRARPRGLGLAVVAGLCFGAMLVFMHLAAVHGVLRALVAMRITSTSVAVVAGLALWLWRGRSDAAASFPLGKALLLAMLAGVLDTSGNLLYLLASRTGRLDIPAVLSSLYPASTILLAAWLLRERTTRSQAVGMVLAMVAVVLIVA